MGLSSDSPEGAVTETRSMTGESRSPGLTDEPNVVKVDEDPDRDLDAKDVKEKPVSLGDYFVCVKTKTEGIFRRNILITHRGFFPT
jgi:hypothetical protein